MNCVLPRHTMNYGNPLHLKVSAKAHGSTCVGTARITSSDRCGHTALRTLWTSWGHPNTLPMQDTILQIMMLRHRLDQGQDNVCQHFLLSDSVGRLQKHSFVRPCGSCLPAYPQEWEVPAFSSLLRHRFSSPVLSALSLTVPTHTKHYHALTLPTQSAKKLRSWHE